MRRIAIAATCACLAVGCAPTTFPTQAQSDAAYKAVREDKSERIAPAALAGMWTGDKGSVLTFGPGHAITYSTPTEKATLNGQYRLENTKLFIADRAYGWIVMQKPDKFMLSTSRSNIEHFRLVASGQ